LRADCCATNPDCATVAQADTARRSASAIGSICTIGTDTSQDHGGGTVSFRHAAAQLRQPQLHCGKPFPAAAAGTRKRIDAFFSVQTVIPCLEQDRFVAIGRRISIDFHAAGDFLEFRSMPFHEPSPFVAGPSGQRCRTCF
jgi:hypothetical protein